MRRTLLLFVAVACAEPHALPAVVQAQTQNVEVEPVTCWWRTSATSVRVGEPFTVILTCSLLHTEAAQVVADESRLEPSVVQLTPFDVMGGARARDVRTADRRFIQFEYRLRAIGENVFGTDVTLPPLEITYRVQSRVAGGESLAGRDLTYALPPLTLRVLSLVPDTANDIREAPIPTFAEIERIDSRGTMFRAAALVALALGALTLALGIVGAIRRRRTSRPVAAQSLSRTAVLSGVRHELKSIQEQVRSSGWTSDLAARAAAAARVVAAYATGRSVVQRHITQRPAPADSQQGASGEVVVRHRLGSPAAVSSAVTTVEDDELGDALARLTTARYGRQEAYDARVDEALDAVVRRINRLIASRPWTEKLWPR